MSTVVSIENVSKAYRLGQIGAKTLSDDLKIWWAKMCKSPNPLLKVGQQDFGNREGETVWALKDVSFTVQEGEVLGIIGRNGAGKSTLLKILSRVTAPTSGQIRVKGRIASLLEVGTGFHPDLTGRENIYLNGAILGMSKIEVDKKLEEIITFSEIGNFIDTPVKRYSSGMYVRLAFAVAAHLESEILIVDEVLAVGDASFQQKCLGKMGDVARGGRTVLFVSHNMSAIASLTRGCLWIHSGKVQDHGSTDEVTQRYLESIAEQANNGVIDLRDISRSGRISQTSMQFTWAKTLDSNGNATSIFYEMEPILFSLGFEVKHKVIDVQLGLGISNVRQWIELFTMPSKVYPGPFFPGKYVIQLRFDSKILQPGLYTTAIKLFANGLRQDTISQPINFSIIKQRQVEETSQTVHAPWISGSIRMVPTWSSISHDETL